MCPQTLVSIEAKSTNIFCYTNSKLSFLQISFSSGIDRFYGSQGIELSANVADIYRRWVDCCYMVIYEHFDKFLNVFLSLIQTSSFFLSLTNTDTLLTALPPPTLCHFFNESVTYSLSHEDFISLTYFWSNTVMTAEIRWHKLTRPSHFLWHYMCRNMTVMYSTREIQPLLKISKSGYFGIFVSRKKNVFLSVWNEIILSSYTTFTHVDSGGYYTEKSDYLLKILAASFSSALARVSFFAIYLLT